MIRMRVILLKMLVWMPFSIMVGTIMVVLVFRYVPVKYTPLMLKRWVMRDKSDGYCRIQEWIPLEGMGENVIKAVVLGEDARFWQHCGVDLKEIGRMLVKWERGDSRLRGCSTISQQVAKNCFTFCSDTALRKILELYWTGVLEIFWSKERILEVYLNVAEMGYGIYGVEAAAQNYFGCSSCDLGIYDAAALAVCLPCPLQKSPFAMDAGDRVKMNRLLMALKR